MSRDFKAKVKISCVYSSQVPPSFAETPKVLNGTTGVAKTWTLPDVTAGWGDVKSVTISDTFSYSNIITLSGTGTSYSLVYNGGYGSIT